MSDDPTARWRRRIAPVLDHVRENPTADLGVHDLARVVHFSPYHFHRVFTQVVGETVALHVRRVRLERAIQLMRTAPDRTLGRIALESGFGSASEFSRAFRRHFGVAPSGWDRVTPMVFRKNPQDGDREAPYDLRAMVAADDGPEPEVHLEELPARRVAFLRIRMPFREGALEEGYRRFRDWLDGAGVVREDGQLWGMSWDDVEMTPPEQIRYDFACPVPDDVAGSGEVRTRNVPALTVAVAPMEGSLTRNARVWDHLYRSWLPASRWEPASHPAFERYRDWPERLDWDDWRLDCCIPLRSWRG